MKQSSPLTEKEKDNLDELRLRFLNINDHMRKMMEAYRRNHRNFHQRLCRVNAEIKITNEDMEGFTRHHKSNLRLEMEALQKEIDKKRK